MIIHSLNLGGNMMPHYHQMIRIMHLKAFLLCGSYFPFLARSHSLTCLTPKVEEEAYGWANQLRIFKQVIGVGCKHWVDHRKMKRQVSLDVCESASACVFICVDVMCTGSLCAYRIDMCDMYFCVLVYLRSLNPLCCREEDVPWLLIQ